LGYGQPIFGSLVTREIEDDLSTHEVMIYEPGDALSAGEEDLWSPTTLAPGTAFRKPSPLFKKLDPGIVAEERERLGN
jgi:methionyl-tRNA synthetase